MISGSVLNPYWLIAAWVHVCVDFPIPLSTGSLCQFSERCLLAVGTLKGKSQREKAQCKCQPLTQLSLCNLPHNAPGCTSSIIAWGEGEGVMRRYRVSPSLCPWQESGASALRKFQEKKDRNIVHSRKARKWMGRKEVWIEGVARETAGSSGGLSDCRSSRGRRREGRRHSSAGEIKINGAWQISWSVTFTFFFSLLVALFKRRKKEGEGKKTLHRPPSHDYRPSSPPLSLSSRPSSSLMTELLAGDMKAAFSPPLVSTWNGGEGRQAVENVKLDSGLISVGILPRFTTVIPLPQHSPLRYFCPPISTCETFIKKLTLGSGPCRPCCPPGADGDTSLTTACQYTFHISFAAEGNHPCQCVRIFTLQSVNPVEASFHSRSRAPQMCSEDIRTVVCTWKSNYNRVL